MDAYVVRNRENYLHFRWRIKGTGALVIPPIVGAGPEDELWRTTCFELFWPSRTAMLILSLTSHRLGAGLRMISPLTAKV